tara:strand:- start:574 stop:807 length:234 start_codon:yes stop_codon:yes gene_type:complete
MTSFILAYPSTLRTYPAKEEAEAAARLLNPADTVTGVFIYEIEQVGYIDRTSMVVTEKLQHEDTPDDDDNSPSKKGD